MQISDIGSVELDRTVAFSHRILIKDKTGHILQSVPVKENVEWEQLMKITDAWLSNPLAHPEPPTEQELYERRK